MAAQYITHQEFEDWQDHLTTYIDKKFETERAYYDKRFDKQDAKFDALTAKFDALTDVVMSLAQATQQNTADIRALTGIVSTLVQTVQQNSADIRQNTADIQQNSADIRDMQRSMQAMHADIVVLGNLIARQDISIRALIKLAPPKAFAKAYAEVEEELDNE